MAFLSSDHAGSYLPVTRSPTAMAGRYEIIDPDGDLEVILASPSSILGPCGEAESSRLETTVGELDNPKEAQPTTLFRVSLKHVAFASPYFNNRLQKQLIEDHGDGGYCWRVEGFDADAMAIVLNVIHGKSSQVPLQLDLDTLAELARIVDYMQCLEVITVYANRWIDALEHQITESYNSELLLWICIAGVFRRRVIFERCTRVAIFGNHSGIATFGLPILPAIKEEINRRRTHHLDKIFTAVYDLMDHLGKGTRCCLSCDSLCLGVLTKCLYTNSFTSRPTSPYTRLSVARAVKMFNSLPSQFGVTKKVKGFIEEGRGLSTVASSDLWEPAIKGDPDWDTLCLHCGFDELITTICFLQFDINGLGLEDIPCTQ
ncbi:hypothetical protein O1611_g864 [Lasiodiplodia mahajangana]|uniref:Uncharacterized protein n=1 Tax=Lasiodiplodia mahajangana TaxID=1108764 RepID=A0ACC2JZR2_9PEZI|nr:hypothetical protein O1611_g864 [Lasiodiplodia mahajangana]